MLSAFELNSALAAAGTCDFKSHMLKVKAEFKINMRK
jgi:hypothetical protein